MKSRRLVAFPEAQDKASCRLKLAAADMPSGESLLWVQSRHVQCKSLCPLYPQKRTCAVQPEMSALGQKRTHALHKQKDRLAAVSPKTPLYALSQSTRALRQARAGAKGEGVDLRGARSNF